jgi:hypothetical protein
MMAEPMAELSNQDWEVRTAVYRHFLQTGRAPTSEDLAGALNRAASVVEKSLVRLDRYHHLVLAPGTHNLWMANPFSARPTDFPVEAGDIRYWANCAWDALGIPVILARDTWTRTRCAETGTPIEFGVKSGRLQAGEEVIHFVVPARAFYDNIGFT